MIRKIFKHILLNLINTKNKTAINYNIIEERFIQSLRIRDDDVVFDVGCHNGETIERLLRVNKRLKIHSFEPDYDCFKKILNKYKENKNIIINNLALGKKKEKKKFYINNNSATSSFLKINKNFEFENIKFKTVRKKEITLETLDNYCQKNQIKIINFLKLDTQGWEKEILLGAIKLLKTKKIKKIQIEITLCQHYEKKFTFLEFEEILLKYGYSLINLGSPTWDDKKKKILWVDALYSL